MKIINKNILDVDKGVIVQSCNCLGIWGGGLALQMKNKYYSSYKSHLIKIESISKKYKEKYGCFETYFLLGEVDFFKVSDNLTIANLFGQDDINKQNKMKKTCYKALIDGFKKIKIFADGEKIYIPYGLGCGLGGGDWEIVENIVENIVPNCYICKL
jgi:O-acetyl-ADP-ribose deacetylase (regulator of RNase III)